MTAIQFARAAWPELSEEQASTVLWNATAFPFNKPRQLWRQLCSMRRRSGTNFHRALHLADHEIENAMRRIAP